MGRPSFELRKITLPGVDGRVETDQYRAITVKRKTFGKEWIVKKMLATYGLNLPPKLVESVVDHILDTMMDLTLQEGCSYQWGDYLLMRLDVRGNFEGEDEPFDPSRHEVRLTIRGGKRLRRKVQDHMDKPGCRPVNIKGRPWARIENVHSERSGIPNKLFPGRNIVIEGTDLELLCDAEYVDLGVESPNGEDIEGLIHATCPGMNPAVLENTPTKLVLAWPSYWTEEEIGRHESKVHIRIWSSGGKPGGPRRWANYSKHQVTLTFDT